MSILERFRKAQAIPVKQQVIAFIGDSVAYNNDGYRVSYIKISHEGIQYGLNSRFADGNILGIPQDSIIPLKRTKNAPYQGQPILWPGDQVVIIGTGEESVVKYVIARLGNPYWSYFVGNQAFTDKDYPSKIKKVERGQLDMFEGPSL
jgi:hypothetical protein